MNNLEQMPKLMESRFSRGSITSAETDATVDCLAPGSENCYLSGTGKVEILKGATVKGGLLGGFSFFNILETFASLGAAADSSRFGSVFNVFSAIFFIGAGALRLAGASLAETATSTLSLLIKRGGNYLTAESGAFQAGLVVSSAPQIRAVSPPAGFVGHVNGVVSVVVWRIRSSTGARSIQSAVSNVVGAINQAIAVTIPGADENGQDYWGIGVTKHGEGAIGSHFHLTEISEAHVAEQLTRTNVATNSASLNITSAGATFSSSLIGWKAVLTKTSPSMNFTTFVTDVPSATTLTLDAMPPVTTTDATLVLSRGEGGTARTVVIEWRDGDLVAKEFAPTRDFAPPAGLFAGTLESIAFVDGAITDMVDGISASGTSRGSAIAPSEEGRPESYSPDRFIFTDDVPTCLLRANGYYARFSAHSMYIIRYTGGEAPLSVEPAWSNVGVLYQNNACIGEGNRIYTWSGIPFRMGNDGLPDSSFANRIIEDFAGWTDASKVVLGTHNVNFLAVCYCYEKTIRAYFPALDVWAAPFDLTDQIVGNITGCVTVNNQLIISTSDGTTDRLYDFNVGTGMVAKIQTGWRESVSMLDTVNTVVSHVRCDNTANPVVIEILADYDNETPAATMEVDITKVGYQRLLVQPNVQDCQAHSVRLTIRSTTATGSAGAEKVQTYGDTTGVLY